MTTYHNYPLFNIFDYEYILINENDIYNLYLKKDTDPYYENIKFPKYTSTEYFPRDKLYKLFLYDNTNNNFYFCNGYNSDGMDLILQTENEKMELLYTWFYPDVTLNIICNLYHDNTNTKSTSISFSFSNYINPKYLISDFVLSLEKNNIDNIVEKSKYKTLFNGFIKFVYGGFG